MANIRGTCNKDDINILARSCVCVFDDLWYGDVQTSAFIGCACEWVSKFVRSFCFCLMSSDANFFFWIAFMLLYVHGGEMAY